MGYKSFRIGVVTRVVLLMLFLTTLSYLVVNDEKYMTTAIIGIVVFFMIYNLIHYVENTNRQLGHFFDSIKNSDFITGFRKSNKLGASFQELNQAFDNVLGIFRETRAEKEEHLQYLNTVVQHVGVGLLSFNDQGKIELINNAARKLLQASQLVNIQQFKDTHPNLYDAFGRLSAGQKILVQFDSDTNLSIHLTELRLRGRIYKLVSLQNIQAELQHNEVAAWQNLTRVLRHEIMNSIAPIATLVATLIQILEQEIKKPQTGEIDQESLNDFSEGLKTIESRTTALIGFVDAYRSFNNIPQPKFQTVSLKALVTRPIQLLKAEIHAADVIVELEIENEQLTISADPELIEMVLINLLKNALEALKDNQQGKIKIAVKLNTQNRVIIEIMNNGPVILPEVLDQIFIPFYTTKKDGSGIGLSLSRQIMQLHRGYISVQSKPGKETKFTLRF